VSGLPRTVPEPVCIRSRDNPLVKRLLRLVQDTAATRRLGQVWLEGEHLCSAALARSVPVRQAVCSEAAWALPRLRALAGRAERVAVLPAPLFAALSALPSPAGIGFLIDLPAAPAIDPLAPSVVLDRLQDAGNVGSILRSAAAFGIGQVLALRGTAGLWSPKVLRAGMGAHFGLRLIEGLAPEALDALRLPLLATSSHAALALADAALPPRCAWVLGHEGQGVDAALLARCALTLRIPQPGGEESLNVAAAAAVCFYEAARQRAPVADDASLNRSAGPGAGRA
jgi:RNA methyltransferase, TrmH family